MSEHHMTKEEKKRFAPLQNYEDRQKSIWMLLGALATLVGFLIGRYV